MSPAARISPTVADQATSDGPRGSCGAIWRVYNECFLVVDVRIIVLAIGERLLLVGTVFVGGRVRSLLLEMLAAGLAIQIAA